LWSSRSFGRTIGESIGFGRLFFPLKIPLKIPDSAEAEPRRRSAIPATTSFIFPPFTER